METTIGGDRLGSGNKQELSFKNYERSTHDLGYIWRSSMAAGTLVPFLCKVGLPGDKWEIDLNADVLTLPTLGPLFGSYKVQLDIFKVPMRLYNAKLHMNRLGIGMDMKSIFLPQLEVKAANLLAQSKTPTYDDNEQINSSCLLKYLGISGLGSYNDVTPSPITRQFNAIPYLAYWDIYKNYYSNKQEEIGYFIHTNNDNFEVAQTPIFANLYQKGSWNVRPCLQPQFEAIIANDYLLIQYPENCVQPDYTKIILNVDAGSNYLTEVFTNIEWIEQYKRFECNTPKAGMAGKQIYVRKTANLPLTLPYVYFGLESFPLSIIDEMRDKILQYSLAGPVVITSNDALPYGGPMQLVEGDVDVYSAVFSQEGLAIKTYQSDLFNNWINTEWIDGTGGISELTAVDTTTGEFTIDALNIATKVYEMLNRIAVSGGTYDDWLEAVYTHERVKGVENPVYCGSLIKELAFEEVVSLAATSETDGQKAPLGTLAGRGRLTHKHKGGKITISVNEPSYVIGIVSLTPRVDYSQGNEWDVNLKTLDDLHKPALDGIGFQDLITEQLLWSDTTIDDGGLMQQNSLGKQPAWINYMTAVNKTFGSFAEPNNSMFMTLNRRYAKKQVEGFGGRLKDGTTYIDPTKYNNIFAETDISSQNFWVQIACNITARRKMSAKIIPNL